MARSPSRPQRWSTAIDQIKNALAEIEDAKSTIEGAFEDLRDLQGEYEDWRDGLPEVAQGTAVNDKLDAIVDLSLEPDRDDLDGIQNALDEAEGADLPLGFGRD